MLEFENQNIEFKQEYVPDILKVLIAKLIANTVFKLNCTHN